MDQEQQKRIEAILFPPLPDLVGKKFPKYPLAVDYDKSVEQLLVEGKYGVIDHKIISDKNKSVGQLIREGKFGVIDPEVVRSNFPQDQTGKKEVIFSLVTFDIFLDAKKVLLCASQIGLRRPTIREGLTFANAHPNLADYKPLVILCESNLYGLRVPFISRQFGRPDIGLTHGGHLPSGWKFILVQQ